MSEPISRIQSLQKKFLDRGLTLALAESCTGGLLGGLLTSPSGASGYFLGGAVVYSNAAKTRLLAVPERLLQKFGAVSPECARAMACGALRAYDSDLALSITGIAGPGGATEGKPVGTVCFGLARRGRLEIDAEVGHFSGDRDAVRAAAVAAALSMLERELS